MIVAAFMTVATALITPLLSLFPGWTLDTTGMDEFVHHTTGSLAYELPVLKPLLLAVGTLVGLFAVLLPVVGAIWVWKVVKP